MKVNVEIECTPEEARAFMGLPDVSAANRAYVDSMTQAIQGASNPDQVREYAAALAPMGQAGLKLFQSFMDGSMRAAASPYRASSDKDASSKKAS